MRPILVVVRRLNSAFSVLKATIVSLAERLTYDMRLLLSYVSLSLD